MPDPTPNQDAISLSELSFIRYVLIPRAAVQGPEVDELVRLRRRLDGILARIQGAPTKTEPTPPQEHAGE